MATVRVNLQVGGIARVREGCRTVKETVAQLEQQASKIAAKAASDRAKIQGQLTKERIRGENTVAKEMLRLQGTEAKATQKTAQERIKAAAMLQRELIRGERAAGRETRREAEQTARAVKKAADDIASYKLRVQQNSAKAAGRLAAKEVADEERLAKQRQRALGGNLRTLGGAAGRGIGNVISGAARFGGAALALGGGFAAADIVRSQMSNEAAAIALSNSAYQGGGGVRLKSQDLLKMAGRVSGSTGTDRGQLLQGLQDYVALSGNPKILQDEKGEAAISSFAKIAKGSGADLGDILKSAGALASQNSNLTPEQQAEMLRNVVGQGKMGAVELPDLARVAGRVAATATQYQGNQADNQRKQLALTQISRKTAGSADDAATAVVRFGSDVARNASKNGMASRVMDDRGKLRDNADILAEYFAETKGNVTKMGEGKGNLGLGAESIKVAQAVSSVYEDAVAKAKSGGANAETANKAGAEAVRSEVKRFEGASYSEKDVQDDFEAVMKGSAARMDAALQKISGLLQDKAAPFIEKLANAFEKNGPKIEKFLNSDDFAHLLKQVTDLVKWLAENPWKGLAAVVGASMAKEIAMAGIPMLIKAAFNRFAGGGGGGPNFPVPTPGGGGAMGGLGKAGTVLAVAGAVVGGAEAGMYLGGLVNEAAGASSSASAAGADRSGTGLSGLVGINSRLKDGKVTSEDAKLLSKSRKQAAQEVTAAQAEVDRLSGGGKTFWEKASDNVQRELYGEDVGAQRMNAAQSRLEGAKNFLGNAERLEQGVAKKLSATDVIDADAVKNATTEAIRSGIEAATGNAKTDPNAPGRNVPMGARPPA